MERYSKSSTKLFSPFCSLYEAKMSSSTPCIAVQPKVFYANGHQKWFNNSHPWLYSGMVYCHGKMVTSGIPFKSLIMWAATVHCWCICNAAASAQSHAAAAMSTKGSGKCTEQSQWLQPLTASVAVPCRSVQCSSEILHKNLSCWVNSKLFRVFKEINGCVHILNVNGSLQAWYRIAHKNEMVMESVPGWTCCMASLSPISLTCNVHVSSLCWILCIFFSTGSLNKKQIGSMTKKTPWYTA